MNLVWVYPGVVFGRGCDARVWRVMAGRVATTTPMAMESRRHGWCNTAEAKELTGSFRRRSERVRGVASAHQEPLRQARGRQWRRPWHGCSGTAEVAVALLPIRVRLHRQLWRRAHVLTHTMRLYSKYARALQRKKSYHINSWKMRIRNVMYVFMFTFLCNLNLFHDDYDLHYVSKYW
jgi:hypothetical protein